MNTKELTGYPSIDKPWLKYYSEEAINAPLPEGSLYEYMISQNRNNMDGIALNYFGKKITYSEFDGRINDCAKALTKCGVKQGDVVSLCMLTMPETLVLLYAINKIGAVCNFLVLNAIPQEIVKLICRTDSKILFCVGLAIDKVKEIVKDTPITKVIEVSISASMPKLMAGMVNLKSKRTRDERIISWKDFINDGKDISLVGIKVKENDLAVLECTSGTTGESKAVMLSNQAINSVVFGYKMADTVFDFKQKEKFLALIPPFLTVGLVTTLIMPLCMGFELILRPDPNPDLISEAVIKCKPNHLCVGPLHINNLYENPIIGKMDLSFMSTVAYGGDKSDISWESRVSDFFHEHGVKYELVNGYGLTEVGASFCTTAHKTKEMIPFVKNNICILDVDTGKELSIGEEGEVCITGPSLMLGYYKNEEETRKVVFERNGERWLKTGDLGYVSSEGGLNITGRIKRLFCRVAEDKITYRVYPMKIEETICKMPEVKQCAVVGKIDLVEQYVPIAYVVAADNVEQSKLRKSIIGKCEKELDSVSQPVEIRFVDKLPVTRASKVDYASLESAVEEMPLIPIGKADFRKLEEMGEGGRLNDWIM